MTLAKCVQVAFLIFLCLSICSASRVLMDPINFKKSKNGQSHVSSSTTLVDSGDVGDDSLGGSLNEAHSGHNINPFSLDSTHKRKKVGKPSMAHKEHITYPFSFDSILRKKKVGEAHVALNEPIINTFSFDVNFKKKRVDGAHVIHREPIKKIGEANMVHSEPITNPFSFDVTLMKKKVGESNIAHSEPIINPSPTEVTLMKRKVGEAHKVHNEPNKKVGEAQAVHGKPLKRVGEANVAHSEPIITLKKKNVGEGNMAHNEHITNPFFFESALKEKQDGEGVARTTNQRAVVSEPQKPVNEVQLEDGLLLQVAAPVLDKLHSTENGFMQATMTPPV